MIVKKSELKNYLHVNDFFGVVLKDYVRWKVDERKNEGDYSSYILTDTITDCSYFIDRVFGLEQISDDEFIAFQRYGYVGPFGEFGYRLQKYQFRENAITVTDRLPEEYGGAPLDEGRTLVIVNRRQKKSNR